MKTSSFGMDVSVWVLIVLVCCTVTGKALSESYLMRFNSVGKLYEGDRSLERLQAAHVVAIGLGGVGSWACEALARSGVGRLTLIDADDICESNINRQSHALSSSIGQLKADALKKTILDINPECCVCCVYEFVTPETVDKVLAEAAAAHESLPGSGAGRMDFVLDMVDSVRDKAAIIHHCGFHGVPVVSCGGVGGLRDPTRLCVSDLARAEGDLLVMKTRKLLRKDFGWPSGYVGKRPSKRWGVKVVHTTPMNAKRGTGQGQGQGQGGFRACDTYLGNAAFVTGTCGFLMASTVVAALAADAESEEGAHPPVVPMGPLVDVGEEEYNTLAHVLDVIT